MRTKIKLLRLSEPRFLSKSVGLLTATLEHDWEMRGTSQVNVLGVMLAASNVFVSLKLCSLKIPSNIIYQ